ncbi:ABC transporter permease [Cupriavidus sp. KB_39]|uniref:ABC transporter permease n=1 Tax=Cupriavidus sp. KB_39 TaxID=3233036 RepID=UPI003F926126
MTTTSDLADLAVQALAGKTEAGGNVFAPRDWPTWSGEYTVLMLHAPSEEGTSLGRNAPQFDVTATLQITGRMQVPAQDSDATASVLETKLEAMREQIKRALINSPQLMPLLQQFPFFRSRIVTDPSGEEHLGELSMEIGMEFYQGPEDFYPVVGEEVQQVNLHLDATNVYDSSGTYADPPFPQEVVPAPRTSGPDGRDEGTLQINLSE